MKRKLLIINKLGPHHIDYLTRHLPNVDYTWVPTLEEATPYLEETEIIAMWGFQDLQSVLGKMNNLKWVHSLSAGVERLAIPEVWNRQITLTNSKGVNDTIIADHVLSMIFAFSHHLPDYIHQKDKKIWKRHVNSILEEQTLAIVGLGSIGSTLAKKAKAFGMKVIAFKQHPTPTDLVDEIYPSTALLEHLDEADYVSISLPETPQTHHICNKDFFAAMKDTAIFINIARGSLVQEIDLCKALEDRIIGGAALDVMEQEPLPPNHPFWNLPNLLLTPHIAAFSSTFLLRSLQLLVENIQHYEKGELLKNRIDPKKGY